MMKTRFSTTFFFLVLSAAMFSGCTSSQNTLVLNPTQGVQLLAGEYTTLISAEDINKFTYSSDPSLGSNQGVWRINLTDEGRFSAELNGGFIANGSFATNGNELEIQVNQVCEDCECRNSIDRYYWGLQDDKLSLAHKAGTCTGLRLLLTAHPLSRNP